MATSDHSAYPESFGETNYKVRECEVMLPRIAAEFS
jgi:hypothetical protein